MTTVKAPPAIYASIMMICRETLHCPLLSQFHFTGPGQRAGSCGILPGSFELGGEPETHQRPGGVTRAAFASRRFIGHRTKKVGLSETDVSLIAFWAALLIIFVPHIIWLIGYVVWLHASDEFRDRIIKKYPSIGNFYR